MDISNVINNLNKKNEKNSKDKVSSNDEKLIEILQAISNDYLQEGEIEKYKQLLKAIYSSENFRHKYSQITSYLLTIKKENKDETFGFISHNISKIYNEINEDDTIKQQVLKLSDHINLEILRIKDINTFKKEFQEAEKNLEQTKTKIKNMECEAKETIKEISKLNDEVKSSRREYITILGVFASIILAFVAGLSFSNAVLSNIDKASIYRLSFIVCLIGFFITNILHYLYKFIKDIHFNNYSNKSKGEKSKFYDSYICKFNAFIAIIILCIFIVWAFETEIKHLKQYIIYYLFC